MVKEAEDRDVPRGVLLVAILALALFIAIVIATLHAAITGNEDMIDSFSLLSSQNIWVVGIITGIFAVIFFSIFIGLLYVRGWGRAMVMVFGLPGVVVYLFKSIILVSSIAEQIKDKVKVSSNDIIVLASALGTITAAVMALWYLSRPNVILAFEAQEVVMTKRKISEIERKIQWGRQRCNAGEISKAELAKLRAECLATEKVLRGRIRHLDQVRLARERKQKEAEDRAVERREEKQARKEKKETEKEERKAEKELEREERGKEKEDTEKKENPSQKEEKESEEKQEDEDKKRKQQDLFF